MAVKVCIRARKKTAKVAAAVQTHELSHFKPCTFGDGGFYYHDGADRAVCTCGWESAAVQRKTEALVALWKIHKEEKEKEKEKQ